MVSRLVQTFAEPSAKPVAGPAPTTGEDIFKIDARALHGWLGSEVPFHQWIVRRLREYAFQSGEDYRTKKSVRADGRKGRPRTDYRLTLDMAKELAMVERFGRHPIRFVILCQK